MLEVIKTKMTDDVIRSIAKIDKEFYTEYDLSWYFERYSDKNDIFLLTKNGKIEGYFLFLEISKKLFDEICQLKYENDYDFPVSELNCESGYFYMPSVIVKKKYRNVSQALIRRLFFEAKSKQNLVVITVSNEGRRMASKALRFLGVVNAEKDIRVYAK